MEGFAAPWKLRLPTWESLPSRGCCGTHHGVSQPQRKMRHPMGGGHSSLEVAASHMGVATPRGFCGTHHVESQPQRKLRHPMGGGRSPCGGLRLSYGGGPSSLRRVCDGDLPGLCSTEIFLKMYNKLK
ncbi:hypothetical protein SUGI_0305150 [Cryptomeria japonica]|nr:hypothetical protein SUGI_0305150 [Cryptomeria japonica]